MRCATELGITLDEIVVSGGGSNSPLFMRIFADVFGVPASRSVDGGGASLGAAMCAAVAAGVYPDMESAAAAMTGGRRVVRPRFGQHCRLPADEPDRVPRHPQPHRRAVRALLPDLPLNDCSRRNEIHVPQP